MVENISQIKRRRMVEKRPEYEKSGGPISAFSTKALVDHFLAEVGKFAHAYFHQTVKGDKNDIAFTTGFNDETRLALADLSNLHDMLTRRADGVD